MIFMVAVYLTKLKALEKKIGELEPIITELPVLKKIIENLSQQLARFEQKVDEHNEWGRRLPVMEEKHKVTEHRLLDIEKAMKP